MDDVTIAPKRDPQIQTTAEPRRTGGRLYRLFEVYEPLTGSYLSGPYRILKYCVEGGDVQEVIGQEDEWYSYPDYAEIPELLIDMDELRRYGTDKITFTMDTVPTKPNPDVEFFNRVMRKIRMESPHLQEWKVEL